MTYSVMGLGKLGASMVAAIASRGYNVIGVDIHQHAVDLLAGGRAPVQETKLEETIAANRERLRATVSHREAILDSDVTFVVVATPSQVDGTFSNTQIEAAARAIGRALKDKADFHVVAVTSTVMPGTTEGVVKPILERTSGKRCGEEFGLAYNPEFIALGSVIHDFLNPDFVLVGEMDRRTGDYLADLYAKLCENNPPVVRMSLLNAEIAKLALNCYITTKITFANALAEVCERTPGANVDVVTGALGLDTRVGPRYLKGGLGFGGPCFPRDNRAFAAFANTRGVQAEMAVTVDRINAHQVDRIVDLVKGAGKRTQIAILGLSYKPNTDIVEDSQPIDIARKLQGDGAEVSVYDPMALENACRALGSRVRYARSVEECLEGADVCIIATPWDEFRGLEASVFSKKMQKGAMVLDCWRILKDLDFSELQYIGLGLGA